MDLVDILAGLGPENLAEKRKALMQWRINSAMGMLAPTTGTGVEAATRMLPMTGEAWTANDAGNAIQDGQYGKAAMMGLLGLLPLGGMMSAGLRAGATVPKRMGQSGAIAWHGSPHKFDKFSLDKIGTGEGAQAYGHGLYLAESPEVARTYSADRAYVGKVMDGKSHNLDFTSPQWIAQNSADEMGGADAAISHLGKVLNQRRGLKAPGQAESNAQVQAAIDLLKSGQIATKGQLYKTDIPDEAVARFLDWDKPLSQQAPEVQAAIQKMGIGERSLFENTSPNIYGEPRMAAQAYNEMARGGADGSAKANASALLQQAGIPGIRYLDGGSRGAGQGSSNFVAFDPELIRILERNGIPTGNQPWKPGEWQGMLSGTK